MKRWVMVGLALFLALTIALPFPALADAPKKATPQPFSATANVVVTNPGVSRAVGNRIFTRGETIDGIVTTVANWPDLDGAALKVIHASEIALAPDGTFAGKARAAITVTPEDGGKLLGSYEATLRGAYHFIGTQLVVDWVLDSGTFKVAGVMREKKSGTFVRAEGDWNASLLLTSIGGFYTLAGQAQMNGTYLTVKSKDKDRDDKDDNHDDED